MKRRLAPLVENITEAGVRWVQCRRLRTHRGRRPRGHRALRSLLCQAPVRARTPARLRRDGFPRLSREPPPLPVPQTGRERPHRDPAHPTRAPRAHRAVRPTGAPTRSVGRVHRHRYHGVLAPNATSRAQVVAIGRPERRTEAPETDDDATSPGLTPEPGRVPASPVRIRWAVLLARIYEVLPLLCSACGGEMRILAFLTDTGRRPSRPRAGRPRSNSSPSRRPRSTPPSPSRCPDQRFASVPRVRSVVA